MKLEITDEISDEIVRQVLRETYESLCHSIKSLEGRLILKPFEEEDLTNNILIARAVRTAVAYFSVHEDHERWLQSVEDELND